MAKWKNYGDVNPREHGGMFVRDTGDGFDLVSVDNQEYDCFKPARYMFKAATVTKADLMSDESLRRYADAYQDDQAQNLMWAATAYLGYYGAHDNVLHTTNFHNGMRAMGINSYVQP